MLLKGLNQSAQKWMLRCEWQDFEENLLVKTYEKDNSSVVLKQMYILMKMLIHVEFKATIIFKKNCVDETINYSTCICCICR